MKVCSQRFFLIRGRSTELPHFLIWFNRWVGVILKCHIGFKEENSTLDICILIIESSQTLSGISDIRFFSTVIY